VRQVTLFTVDDLSSSAITVVDGVFMVYVIIPPAAPRTKNQIGAALQFAKVTDNQSITDCKGIAERPEGTTASMASVVCSDSAPPHNLKAMFRQWHQAAWPFKSQIISTIDLDRAFDMLERDRFSIKELQGDTLPLGVDADKLEVPHFLAPL